MRFAKIAVLGFLFEFSAAAAIADVCAVPGTHDSIQAAVDDPVCNDIQISNRTYFELVALNRNADLLGPVGGSAEINGQLDVSGAATMAALEEFSIESSCAAGGLRVSGGANVSGTGLRVYYSSTASCSAGLLLRHGFED